MTKNAVIAVTGVKSGLSMRLFGDGKKPDAVTLSHRRHPVIQNEVMNPLVITTGCIEIPLSNKMNSKGIFD